jgi:hypothetical protein
MKATRTEGFEQEVAEESEKEKLRFLCALLLVFFGRPYPIPGTLSRYSGRGLGRGLAAVLHGAEDVEPRKTRKPRKQKALNRRSKRKQRKRTPFPLRPPVGLSLAGQRPAQH